MRLFNRVSLFFTTQMNIVCDGLTDVLTVTKTLLGNLLMSGNER